MRVRSSSRRRRAISAAWSEGEATGLADAAPGEPAARGGGEPPINPVRHCLSMEGWIPSSAAICICGRPLLSKSATASRLNSGVNSRLVLAIKHLPRPQGAYQRCPWNRGKIIAEVGPLLGRGPGRRAPFRSSSSSACRPTSRSSAAIRAS